MQTEDASNIYDDCKQFLGQIRKNIPCHEYLYIGGKLDIQKIWNNGVRKSF